MYTTLQNQFQLLLAAARPRRHGEGRPGRLGEVRQDASLTPHAWRCRASPRGAPGPRRSGRFARRRRGTGRAPGDPRNIGWLYVLPGLAFYVLFTLAPLLHTVYYSLFDWDGLTGKTWVGLSNYGEALRDEVLRDTFVHSAILIVYYAVFPVIIGLLLTARSRAPRSAASASSGRRCSRGVIAGVVIAQAWTWIYAAEGR